MPKKKKKSRAPKEPSPTPEPVVNGAAAAARVDDEQATVVTKGDEVLDKSVGKTVFIRGLVSRADLNGARGTILDYNAATERFTVECAPPQSCTVAVKRANLQIAKAAKSDRPRETPFAPMLDFGRLRRWTGANLSDAFEAAVPPTYRMAMAQMKCGIPTRSIAALPAGAQWLYNESYVSQQISERRARKSGSRRCRANVRTQVTPRRRRTILFAVRWISATTGCRRRGWRRSPRFACVCVGARRGMREY
mmetsp:Transcript_24784/g.74511  ORF Transcript_24784/g.74511 Transcript_24784/m.74511 type:complete len:250 (-) Transcript_24784:914-1663(-)